MTFSAGPIVSLDPAQWFNVQTFGAVGDGVTDDTIAINAAIVAAQATTVSGFAAVVYFPAARYLISSAPWGTFLNKPIQIRGDGAGQTIIQLATSLSGDVFGWSECWFGSSFGATSLNVTKQATGAAVIGLTITGDRTGLNTQNGLVFYDRNDFVWLQDVHLLYLTGRAIYSGVTKQTALAFMRESTWLGVRCQHCGNTALATVEFNSVGTGDVTNEIDVFGLNIYAPHGPGIVIASQGGTPSQASVRNIRFMSLRVEGLEASLGGTGLAGDLVGVGSTGNTGPVGNIHFYNAWLVDPYTNSAAISFNAAASNLIPNQCSFRGSFAGGSPLGSGIVVNAGKQLSFEVPSIFTAATGSFNLVVGPSTGGLVASNILVDARGRESAWATSIDPTSAPFVQTLSFGNNFQGPVGVANYLVSALPTGATGWRANVYDATGPAFGAGPTGGGSTFSPVYHDGVKWRIG